MGLVLLTPPAAEPVSLAEAKLHVRADIDEDDALIASLVKAARQLVETWTYRQLVTATWLYTRDGFFAEDLTARRSPQAPYGTYPTAGFYPRLTGYTYAVPANSAIRLPRSPVQSVASVQYVDANGATQTLDPAAYQVSVGREPCVLAPAYGLTWPVPRVGLDSVRITFAAGYGDPSLVPEGLKAAIKLLVGHWYRNRESVAPGSMAELPQAVGWLLRSFDVGEYV